MKQKKVLLLTSLVSLGTNIGMEDAGKPHILGQRAAQKANTTDLTIF